MDKKLRLWSFLGVFIVFGLAAFWHFLYNFLPYDIVGAISPVNESPWEHAKLFFMPAVIYYIVLYFIAGRNYPNFLFAHSIALVVMPIFMLSLFYIYEPLVERTIVLDIINSFLTTALGAFIGYKLTTSKYNLATKCHKIAAVVILLALLCIYTVFTFYPPNFDMFISNG